MTAEFLRSLPAELCKNKIVRDANDIRMMIYKYAALGETKYNHRIVKSQMQNETSVQINGRLLTITEQHIEISPVSDIIAELIRTLDGCKVTHVLADGEKDEYGYNRPESIEIDWTLPGEEPVLGQPQRTVRATKQI